MREGFYKAKTQSVPQDHLADSGGNTAFFHGRSGLDLSCKDQLMYFSQIFAQRGKIQYIAFQQRCAQKYQLIPCRFGFRGYRIVAVDHVHRKRNQSGRHMQVHKGTGHTVFTAHCRHFHTVQHGIGPQ